MNDNKTRKPILSLIKNVWLKVAIAGFLLIVLFLLICTKAEATDTFGYTEDTDYTGTSIVNDIHGTKATCPETGTANSITVKLEAWYSGKKVKCALYDANKNFVAETEERTTGGDGWNTFNFESSPDLTNQVYYIVAFTDAYTKIRFGNKGNGEIMLEDGGGTYPDFPETLGGHEGPTLVCGIYVTYTTEAPPEGDNRQRMRRIMQQLRGDINEENHFRSMFIPAYPDTDF